MNMMEIWLNFAVYVCHFILEYFGRFSKILNEFEKDT